MQTSPALRLAALDDHDIVLLGVRSLLAEKAPEMAVVAVGATVEELVTKLHQGDPVDVCLLDLNLAEGIIVEAAIEALRPYARAFLIYTSNVTPVPIRRAIAAGAGGVALKSDPPATLVESIRDVAHGDFAVSSDLAFILATDQLVAPQLTSREQEALKLLASGVPKKVIGSQMDPPVEASTVATYFNRIAARYVALGRDVSGATSVMREAIKDGYLQPPAR
ncbi:MAG: hypothetical protein ACRCWS_09085 [Propionibacteriaceae bacterium]